MDALLWRFPWLIRFRVALEAQAAQSLRSMLASVTVALSHGAAEPPVPGPTGQGPRLRPGVTGHSLFFGEHIYRLRAPLTAIDPANPQIPSRLNPPGGD